jgi:membrane protein DedA with SNARE-associated domain
MSEGLAAYGLGAIFVVMLLKESGVPIPVPSDLLTIGAGIQAAAGVFGLGELAAALLVAIAVGGSFQFLVIRGAGRPLIERLGGRVGLDAARLEAAARKLRAGGPASVFVGLNLPGARAGVIAAAGLAGFSYASFAPAAIAGTSVFHAWHVGLGFVIGAPAVAMLGAIGLQLVAAVALLAALGALGWLALRWRGGRGAKASGARQWTEAACPVCLAVALVDRRTLL